MRLPSAALALGMCAVALRDLPAVRLRRGVVVVEAAASPRGSDAPAEPTTVLAGREQIYITAGFNRWGHMRRLGPAAMKPPGEGGMHHRVRQPARGGGLLKGAGDGGGGGSRPAASL